MKKSDLKRILKYLKEICGLSKKESFIFLFMLFNDLRVFDLPNKHQKMIIKNILLFFELLVLNQNNPKDYKKKNHNLSQLEIKEHLIYKIKVMIDYPKPKY